MKIRELERELEAYRLIIETPLTIDTNTFVEAINRYNVLDLMYAVKTGRKYGENVRQTKTNQA